MNPQIEFDQTVSYLLVRASTAFRSSLERYMGKIGLHGGQTFVLLELWKKDGMRQVDIAAKLDLAAPTVSKILKGMVDVNLVTLERLEDDGRSTRVFLTDTGYAMRSQVEEQWRELELFCLGGITEAEKMMLFELLSKMRNAYTGRDPEEEE